MLRRLLFGGSRFVAQILIMEAGRKLATTRRYYYGYKTSSPAMGSLAPKYIKYRGKQYEISDFYTTPYGISLLVFQNNIVPSATTIVVEVDDKKYTMVRNEDTNNFRIATSIFTVSGTYTIKFLSIE